ncbi:MAG: PPOX class F420-dependent oxidoreductase [Actinomycetota bacterium]|nr:PPOX class F420-dependent oxidoreductase [Actinomycetota bacterium]
MSNFTRLELDYLTGERRLARLATVGDDGMPHIAPVGWAYRPEEDVIEIGGREEFGRTKKYRDVAHSGRAAIVVDDVLPPWQPRGVEVRGRSEAIPGPPAVIRIHPDRVISWGLDPQVASPRDPTGGAK